MAMMYISNVWAVHVAFCMGDISPNSPQFDRGEHGASRRKWIKTVIKR
jgi:hypothetical protein